MEKEREREIKIRGCEGKRVKDRDAEKDRGVRECTRKKVGEREREREREREKVEKERLESEYVWERKR